MKNLKKYLYLFLFISFQFFACSQKGKSTDESGLPERQASPTQVLFTKKNSIEKEGIYFSEIMVDTLTEEDKRVKLSFTVQMDSIAFTREQLKGFDGFLIDVKCSGKNNSGFCLRKRTDYSQDLIPVNTGFIFSSKGKRTLTANVPLRVLELVPGTHNLDIEISALPIRFKPDSSYNRVKKIEFISDKPVASIAGSISIKAPKLHKVSITVHSFKINRDVVDIHKYDFALGGTGLPDLFWNVHCGSDFIYHCPVQKNATAYKKAYTSSSFLCSEEDWITLGIYDFDNGPFNVQDDVIEVWKKRLSECNTETTDTLSFGNLSQLILQIKKEN